MRKYIYKMTIDCGRLGDLCGQFIDTEEEVSGLIGKSAFFSEPFGRHSDVQVVLEEKFFERVDCDESTVLLVEGLDILPFGHYPFDAVN